MRFSIALIKFSFSTTPCILWTSMLLYAVSFLFKSWRCTAKDSGDVKFHTETIELLFGNQSYNNEVKLKKWSLTWI